MLNVICKWSVMIGLTTSIIFSGTADAATKQEKQVTTQFTKYKAGMTISEFAKIRYGKSYKKHLTKTNGRTVLKEKPIKEETSEQAKFLYYGIYDRKAESPENPMIFLFTVKPQKNVYRLTLKSLEVTAKNPMHVRQSDKQLKRGKQIEFGMTEQQLDKVLTRKGLGDWTNWTVMDFSHTLSERDMDTLRLGQGKNKTYIFQTNDPNERLLVEMTFDPNEKTYRISGFETVSSNQVINQ
ncbi:hypothetical protein QK289_14680 [Exiguobacterium antarcticum]|uniref:Uncharacterized protein n=1 Tax=Exiguobacterium antarcticum TaxID=132920 RepID=A0ABT6R5M6_9BACL|nr:hypothetical protein [Exiguobacterium antarcticum]MDI3236256.1 hypothetical protein [Exiguobacterium antarcticum]